MIDPKEFPAKGELWHDFLRRKKRWADLLIWEWSFIEHNLDYLMCEVLGFSIDDARADFVFETAFKRKLDFLYKRKVLTKAEYATVDTFRVERNNFFHRMGYQFVIAIDRKEIAESAARVNSTLVRAVKRFDDNKQGGKAPPEG